MPGPLGACPRCGELLTPCQAGAIEMHGCARCAGIFLDHTSGRRFVETIDRTALQIADRADQIARATVDVTKAGIPCPVCARPLQRTTFGGAQVIVDVCSEHGTWVDRGELHQIAAAVSAARGQSVDEEDAAALALKDDEPTQPRPVYVPANLEPDPPPSGVSGSDVADGIELGLNVTFGLIELLASLTD